jgi:hypothetical protein
MPTDNTLRLKDPDDTLKLIYRLVCDLLQLHGENGKCQFLNPAGFYVGVESVLKYRDLLTQDKDFPDLFHIRLTTHSDHVP